jgi:hypothetical protein
MLGSESRYHSWRGLCSGMLTWMRQVIGGRRRAWEDILYGGMAVHVRR